MFNQPPDIASLLDLLRDEDLSRRQQAAIALSRIHDERITPALLNALGDADATVRANAATGLGENRAADAVPQLIHRLQNDESDIVRERAASALGQIGGDEAEDALINAADDAATWVRNRVLYVLGALRAQRAYDVLLESLEDTDKSTVSVAAWALGALGDVRAYDALAALLAAENDSVRGSAAFALGELGDERAIKPLIALLGDDSPDVRAKTAWALGSLGEALAKDDMVPALVKTLDDFTEVPGEAQHQFVCQYAAEALLQVNTDQARQAVENWRERARTELEPYRISELIRRLAHPEAPVRQEAINALTEFDARAVPYLIETLKHRAPRARQSAAQTLGSIAAPDATPALITALTDSDDGVWSQAVAALAKIGKPAVELLEPALKSSKQRVNTGAALALWRINGYEPAFKRVLQALQSDNLLIQSSAINAIVARPDDRAVATLQIALGDAEPAAARYLLHALNAINSPAAQATIQHWLAHHRDNG